MGFPVVIDSRGAFVLYLEIMEPLWNEDETVLSYISDDLSLDVEQLHSPTIVDRFNLAQFSAGSAVYESSDSALTLLLTGYQIFNALMDVEYDILTLLPQTVEIMNVAHKVRVDSCITPITKPFS